MLFILERSFSGNHRLIFKPVLCARSRVALILTVSMTDCYRRIYDNQDWIYRQTRKMCECLSIFVVVCVFVWSFAMILDICLYTLVSHQWLQLKQPQLWHEETFSPNKYGLNATDCCPLCIWLFSTSWGCAPFAHWDCCKSDWSSEPHRSHSLTHFL